MSADDESPPRDTPRAPPALGAPRTPTHAHRNPRKRRTPLVASPHDAFFRAIFSRPEEAAGLVRFMLPAPLGDALDTSSIRVLSPTHVDASLRASQSDVVVAARLAGREVRFIAILEHRSTVESRMALRLWRYSGEAWAREAERRGPLPDVVPLVVYAGKRPWTAPRDLAGLLAPTDEPALTVVIRYLLTVSSSDERPLVHDVVAALPDPEKEEAVKKVKTIADALREEGRAAVLAEVEARIHAEVETRIRAERADALERMRASVEKHLRLKFGALPAHAVERLAQASLDELDGIAERLLFAPSLDAALDAR
jgi:hypothetical protein